MTDFYAGLQAAIEGGADPLELTIQKFEKVQAGEIPFEVGFGHCPMCVAYIDWSVAPHARCQRCPVYQAGEWCLDIGSLYDRINKADRDDRLNEFIESDVLPFLRGLKEKAG